MDAGSGISLIYARTLKAMNISLEWLQPTDCSFHRIVLGSANHPLGKIKLGVCFGDSGNFRREKLEFDVMDCYSQYHVILGWPTFARFMAVPHYAYLTLKIPGPKGVIIVKGSFEVSNTCDKEFNRMAQTFGMTVECARLKGETDHNVLPDIGQNIQVYIDNVVITTRNKESLINDLKETFDNLDRYKLKLNPTKCSFGVSAGQLLGFLVSARGIEANPEKIQAILTMGKPAKLREVQQLAGRVAALSRFVARLGEKLSHSTHL
jgi:hypothetical protein